MATNRETIRDALVVLLTAALADIATCRGSQVADVTGLTPLVAVFSRGSGRERPPLFQGNPTFYLEIHTLVRQAYTGWTNIEAEDKIDEIESIIAEVILTNAVTVNWRAIDYDGSSEVSDVKDVNGILYYLERILVIVQAK